MEVDWSLDRASNKPCALSSDRSRQECLNENWFLSLADARQKVEIWRREYNNERPHSALGQMAPARFARASIVGA